MKPVRRTLKKHFGLTAKEVAIRSKRPWYIDLLIGLGLMLFGYAIAFWQFNTINVEKVNHIMMDNQSMQTQVIKLERKLQIEHASQVNLQEKLETIQSENLKLKEELVFYKNMVEKKKK